MATHKNEGVKWLCARVFLNQEILTDVLRAGMIHEPMKR